MAQRLCIAIVDGDPGWESILRQIGVWFERIDWNGADPARYGAIVVNRSLSSFESGRIGEYLAGGGAVLDASRAELAGVRLRSRSVGTVVGGAPPFERVRLLDVDDRLRVAEGAEALDGTVALREHRGGWLAHVPFDVGFVMRSHATSRRRFHAPHGRHPDEVVARRAKGAYAAVIEGALRWLHARRGLPMATLWRFPGDARGVFAYRIDSDYGTPRHMQRLRTIADRHGVPLTIFLHVAAHVDHLSMFADFAPHELAAHGFRHRTFGSYEANWGNIAEALQVLRAAGIDARGYAAPTGAWNPGLDRALREHGLAYSSEFALDYDGLPFFPTIHADVSPVLQVPIHPVSVGSLVRVGAGEREVAAYFDAVFTRLLAARVPVFLYHHPLQEMWDAVEGILTRAANDDILPMTMGAYAAWWRDRHATRFRATLEAGVLSIERPAGSAGVRIHLVGPDARECLLDVDGAHRLDGLVWGPAPEPVPVPDDLLALRHPTLTTMRHSLEDAISRFRQ